MKKISYLELSSIFLVILITFNSGINLFLIKNTSGIDSWLSIIIGYIIGLIFLLLTIYISNYHKELNLFEKNKHLFKDFIGTIINIIISIIFFIIAITLLYNISSFINTQFLYHTPILITMSLLIILSIYCATKEINIIAHISLLLMAINIIMFILCNISLIGNIKIDNLLPFLKTNYLNIIISSLKIACINTLPILIILIIPKEKITNQNKYQKSLIITYIIGTLISLIITLTTISILGIYLTNMYEYAEYMVLKKVKLFGFLERVENIISMKWITETYIYLTLIIYSLTKNIKKKNKNTDNCISIIIGIVLVITTNYVFKNITIFNNFIKNIFIYIIAILFIIYILITTKIIFTKKE